MNPEPPEWSDRNPSCPLPFWEALRLDVLAHVPLEQRGQSRWAWVWTSAAIATQSSGLHVAALYRVGHAARHRFGPAGRLLAGFLFWWTRHAYGCSIASTARLQGGLIFPHPQGIVIGGGAVVGPRAWIYQNVTIGGAPGKPGLPHVGADARIYAGAVLTGPITVGDNVLIGANAVVHHDVPARTAVRSLAVEYGPLPGFAVSEGL
ncbi:MAG: serine acetyltransferase [Isosphaeraceae bacterium]